LSRLFILPEVLLLTLTGKFLQKRL